MQLLELVYEGGEVLDLCLDFQREALRAEYRDRFQSLDLRGMPQQGRKSALQRLAVVGAKNVLVRGLSGVPEAANAFPRASLLFDAVGKTEPPARSELAPMAFRTKRVFVYSKEMDSAIRSAGIGLISRHNGPYFPAVTLDAAPDTTIGVLSLGRGALEVIAQLKRVRRQEGLEFDIITTEQVAEVVVARSALDVATRASLLVAPCEQMDYGGVHEAAILAVCTGRVLCTPVASALRDMPIGGWYMHATKYTPRSYAEAAVGYRGREAYAALLDAVQFNPRTVSTEIIQRTS